MGSLFSLEGKVAIVTGASKETGRTIAIELAKAGADVVVSARSVEGIEKAAAEIRGLGRRSLAVPTDVREAAQVDNMVQKAVEAFGRVDILVNNAGIIRRARALDFTEADWDAVLNVNLKSLFFLSQAVARRFVAQGGGGKIINIASMLSFQGGILVPSYTASKSGVMGLTKLLACEWAPHGINVNAIAPGYMATRNTQAIQDDPVRSRQILERIPTGRWGKPEDLKGAVVFLASDASNYVQGHTLAVDGGWLAR